MRSPEAQFDLRAALIRELEEACGFARSVHADDAAVHQCRVRLKRARALTRLGRDAAPGLAHVFNDAARAVMADLSHARDLAALSKRAVRLAQSQKAETKRALAEAAARLNIERRRLRAPDKAKAEHRVGELLALAKVWPETSDKQVRKGAKRLAKRARKAYRRGKHTKDENARHTWRKREKDRLYGLTLLRAHWPDKLARRKDLSRKLSGLLGREREIMQLRARMIDNPAMCGGEEAAMRAIEACDKALQKISARADKFGARLHKGGA